MGILKLLGIGAKAEKKVAANSVVEGAETLLRNDGAIAKLADDAPALNAAEKAISGSAKSQPVELSSVIQQSNIAAAANKATSGLVDPVDPSITRIDFDAAPAPAKVAPAKPVSGSAPIGDEGRFTANRRALAQEADELGTPGSNAQPAPAPKENNGWKPKQKASEAPEAPEVEQPKTAQKPVRDTQNSGGNGGSGQEPPKKTGAGDEGEGAGKGDDGGAADKAAKDAADKAAADKAAKDAADKAAAEQAVKDAADKAAADQAATRTIKPNHYTAKYQTPAGEGRIIKAKRLDEINSIPKEELPFFLDKKRDEFIAAKKDCLDPIDPEVKSEFSFFDRVRYTYNVKRNPDTAKTIVERRAQELKKVFDHNSEVSEEVARTKLARVEDSAMDIIYTQARILKENGEKIDLTNPENILKELNTYSQKNQTDVELYSALRKVGKNENLNYHSYKTEEKTLTKDGTKKLKDGGKKLEYYKDPLYRNEEFVQTNTPNFDPTTHKQAISDSRGGGDSVYKQDYNRQVSKENIENGLTGPSTDRNVFVRMKDNLPYFLGNDIGFNPASITSVLSTPFKPFFPTLMFKNKVLAAVGTIGTVTLGAFTAEKAETLDNRSKGWKDDFDTFEAITEVTPFLAKGSTLDKPMDNLVTPLYKASAVGSTVNLFRMWWNSDSEIKTSEQIDSETRAKEILERASSGTNKQGKAEAILEEANRGSRNEAVSPSELPQQKAEPNAAARAIIEAAKSQRDR